MSDFEEAIDRVIEQFKDQLAILLAGRVAEELVLGDVSSGAQNDLEHASAIARGIVMQQMQLGMSQKLGAVNLRSPPAAGLSRRSGRRGAQFQRGHRAH